MPLFDMPLDELRTYRPQRSEPADFTSFWQETLAETRQQSLNARFELVDFGLSTLETFDVTFNGFGGQPIKGWLLLPRQRREPLPCVVEYIGYGGGRGFPFNWLVWSSAGYANLIMDTRGQGSVWQNGDTPDQPNGVNPFYPGFMTQGIHAPHTYYYRRVFSDAVRAIEAARSHSAIDPERIALTGRSQGGGIALAASVLEPSIPVVMPDVPFLCHFRRAADITPTAPYIEIANYLKIHRDKFDVVFDTLAYFDGMNFAAHAKARALFSVALMDDICPPSTVYAAYNHYAGHKDLRTYHYNNHEGGQGHHVREQIQFLREVW